MADNTYPLMLYKAGSELSWEGRNLKTLTVDDAEAHAEAEADGWLTAEEVLSVGSEAADDDGLGKLTKAQLLDLAKAEGTEVETDANKAALIAAIRAGREA